MKELEQLAKEFENNIVAFQILRARVKAYLYNNIVNFRVKQQIASYLKMSVSPALGRKTRGY